MNNFLKKVRLKMCFLKRVAALLEFEMHKSGVFWIGLVTTVFYLCGLIYGHFKDTI